jgi:glycosyltransferase involved in cell wall biosynthesis
VAVKSSSAQSVKPLVIACIPALNEENSVAKVILQAKPYVDKIVVCDDGSTDMTAAIASGLGATVIRHPKSTGYGGAIATLFGAAREGGADIMVTLDADGQHDPKFIPDLIAPIINQTADIVIGSRFLGQSEVPSLRQAGIKVINDVTTLASYKEMTDTQSGFRAYGKAAIEALTPVESGMGASTEILIKAKAREFRVAEVPIIITYNGSPSSQNSVSHGSSVILSTIKHASIEHPLLLFGIPGLILLAVGFAFGGFGLDILFRSGYLPVNIALVAVGAVIFGFMFITTMLILWVLSSIVKELRPSARQYGVGFKS